MTQRVTSALTGQGGATGQRTDFKKEPFLGGLQEFRRVRGVELKRWRAALANRNRRPANIWFIGDSGIEGLGSSYDANRFYDIFRGAIQRMFRYGGAGYLPSYKYGLFFANPDGKNWWVWTGTPTQGNILGMGRRSMSVANGTDTGTITVDCDRFFLVFTSSSATGGIEVTIDPGTPFASTTIFRTNSIMGQSGRIWDSGPLVQGPHVVQVKANNSLSAPDNVFSAVIDGIMVFNTDYDYGVHVFDCSRSGATSLAFSGGTSEGVGVETYWADIGNQGIGTGLFADGVGNGTTTFTSATAAFTAADVGEPLWGSTGTANIPLGTYIVSVTNGTTVVLNNVVAAGSSLVFRLSRAQYANGVTVSGSVVFTSATAAFTPRDIGRVITSANLAGGKSRITKVVDATTVWVENGATASGSSQAFRIVDRQVFNMKPDLLVIEIGVNDMNSGIQPDAMKANIEATVQTAIKRTFQGVAGWADSQPPSVMLLIFWAPSHSTGTFTFVANTTISTPIITSATAYFDPADVGQTVNGTGIPGGTTILSVQSPTQVTLSANATATGTPTCTLVSRIWQDWHWKMYRAKYYELAEEKGYAVLDLYTLSQWIGVDPLDLTVDGLHPNDNGHEWVGDELNQVLSGMPRNAAIPAGIFDARGDLIVASAADTVGKLPVGSDGQIPSAASGAPLGILWSDPGMLNRVMQVLANAGVTTLTTSGFTAAPTATGTPTSADDADGPLIAYTSGIVAGNVGGLNSAAAAVRGAWVPEFGAFIKTDVQVGSGRWIVGLYSATPMAAADPASVHAAGFRYDTVADGTAFWRTYTKDGTTATVKTTTVAFAASTKYNLRIDFTVVAGTVTKVSFYINNVLVSVHTTNLPGASTMMSAYVAVATLNTTAKVMKISRYALTHI